VRETVWASVREAAIYESVVLDNPRKPGEGAMSYIVRLAELAAVEIAKRGRNERGEL
jgi:hypothetical protein